jgi:DNA-binding beta-propeller fold protein YncE
MQITARCAKCALQFSVSQITAGSTLKCPQCRGSVEISVLPDGVLPAGTPTIETEEAPLLPAVIGPSDIETRSPPKPPRLPRTSPHRLQPLKIIQLVAGALGAIVGYALARYCAMYLLVPLLVALAGWLLARKVVKPNFQPMLPAVALQTGHAVWFLIGGVLTGGLLFAAADVVILAAALIWLCAVPGIAPVIALSIYQSIGIASNVGDFALMRAGTDTHRALAAHVLLRCAALAALWYGAGAMFLRQWPKRPSPAWMWLGGAICCVVPTLSALSAIVISKDAVHTPPGGFEFSFYFAFIIASLASTIAAIVITIRAARQRIVAMLTVSIVAVGVGCTGTMFTLAALGMRSPQATFPDDSWLAKRPIAPAPMTVAVASPPAPTPQPTVPTPAPELPPALPPTPPPPLRQYHPPTTYHWDSKGEREPDKTWPVTASKLPQMQLPTAASPGKSVVTGHDSRDGLRVTQLQLLGSPIEENVTWSPTGDAFFALSRGRRWLSRISYPEFVEEHRLDLRQQADSLAMSAEGLLVALGALKEVWVIDTTTLEVKKRISAPDGRRILCGPNLDFALVTAPSRSSARSEDEPVTVLDLIVGQPVRQFFVPVQSAQLTSEGRHYFAIGPTFQLVDFRLEADGLVPSQSTPENEPQHGGIVVSPEGQFVCCAESRRASDAAAAAIFVYSVDDLSKPRLILQAGFRPRAIEFDPAAKLIYVLDQNRHLLVFDEQAQKVSQHEFVDPRRANIFPSRFVSYPSGRKLLVVDSSRGTLWFLELE